MGAGTSLDFDIFARDKTGGIFNKLAKDTDNLENKLGKLKTMAAGALAGFSVGSFLKDAVMAASDLNETVSKTDQVFGASSASIHKWAAGAADSMGLSEQAAESNANAIGLLLTQVGFGGTAAADMSKSWTQLAVDLGSFNNADPTEILESMLAATRGEFDALQRFVPMISAAAVQQKALTLSGKELTSELTEQDKVLAVQALMFEQTGKAQGDFERTSEGTANSLKSLQAKFTDMSAELGEKLLPIVNQVVEVLSGPGTAAFSALATAGVGVLIPILKVASPLLSAFAGAVNAIPGPVLAGVGALLLMSKTAGPLAGFFSKTVSGVRSMNEQFGQTVVVSGGYAKGMKTAAKTMAAAIGPQIAYTAGITGIAIGLDMGISMYQESTQAQRELTQAWIASRRPAEEVAASFDKVAFAAEEAGGFVEFLSNIPGVGNEINDFATENAKNLVLQAEAAGVAGTELLKLSAQQAQVGKATKEFGQFSPEARAELQKLAEMAAEFAGEAGGAAKAANGLADEFGDISKEANDADTSVSDLKDKLFGLADISMSAIEAGLGLAQSQADLNDVVTDSESTYEDVVGALADYAGAGQDVIKSMIDQHAPAEAIAAKMAEVRASFVDAAIAGDMTAEAANLLADQLGLVPENVPIAIGTTGYDETVAQFDTILAKVLGIPVGHSVNVGVIDQPAIDKLVSLGFRVERLPDGTFQVFADTQTALNQAQRLKGQIDRMVAVMTIETTSRSKGGRAKGGPVRAGEFDLVGEEGPELVRWGSDGTVIPHRESMEMLRQSAAGGAAGPVQQMAAAAGGAMRVILDVRGGDDEFIRLIRKWVRAEGL